MKDFFVEQIMSGFLITALPVAFVAGIDGFFLDMTIFSCTIILGRTAMLSKEIVGQK